MLLSFKAGEAIAIGDAVAVDMSTSGHIRTARSSGDLDEANTIGVAVDAVVQARFAVWLRTRKLLFIQVLFLDNVILLAPVEENS